jgi:hypothetical protein
MKSAMADLLGRVDRKRSAKAKLPPPPVDSPPPPQLPTAIPENVRFTDGTTIDVVVPHAGAVTVRMAMCSWCREGRVCAIKVLKGRYGGTIEMRICELCAQEIEAALWRIRGNGNHETCF